MKVRVSRLVLWSAAGVGGALLIAAALWPQPVPVDVATVARGPLRVTIDEEGETRVCERFVVSAPVAGQVLRIELEPGDAVVARTTVVATFRPALPAPLDARTRAEAEARAKAARSAVERARATRDQLQTERDLAEADLRRARELDEARLLPKDRLDAAIAAARAKADAVRAAESAVRAAQHEVEVADAALLGAAETRQRPGATMQIRAPISGIVLRRLRESEAVVAAGEPLLEIGDRRGLEIVADLLSSDAVRVAPGQRVSIEGWGGGQALGGVVRRVEPSAFTKVSALGVEEQRVNVIIAFDDPAAASASLGDAYRVEVRIVMWEGASVSKVPVSSLFRIGDDWAVFAVVEGRAVQRVVTLGPRNSLEAEVKGGLADGDLVVVHPSDAVRDGVRVAPR
jgi:HlyD family secretion protein